MNELRGARTLALKFPGNFSDGKGPGDHVLHAFGFAGINDEGSERFHSHRVRGSTMWGEAPAFPCGAKPVEPPGHFPPAGLGVRGAELPHGSLVHPREDAVGEFKGIRQSLLRSHYPGAEDALEVDVILHGL